jgi:hypothetical protein
LADLYALSTSASLEYAISSVMHIPAYSMYSNPVMQTKITHTNLPKMKQHL